MMKNYAKKSLAAVLSLSLTAGIGIMPVFADNPAFNLDSINVTPNGIILDFNSGIDSETKSHIKLFDGEGKALPQTVTVDGDKATVGIDGLKKNTEYILSADEGLLSADGKKLDNTLFYNVTAGGIEDNFDVDTNTSADWKTIGWYNSGSGKSNVRDNKLMLANFGCAQEYTDPKMENTTCYASNSSGVVFNNGYTAYENAGDSVLEFDYMSGATNSNVTGGTQSYSSISYAAMRVFLRANGVTISQPNNVYAEAENGGAYILNVSGDGTTAFLEKWGGTKFEITQSNGTVVAGQKLKSDVKIDYTPGQTVRYRITTQNVTDGVKILFEAAPYIDGALGEYKTVINYTDTESNAFKKGTFLFGFRESQIWNYSDSLADHWYSAHYIDNLDFTAGGTAVENTRLSEIKAEIDRLYALDSTSLMNEVENINAVSASVADFEKFIGADFESDYTAKLTEVKNRIKTKISDEIKADIDEVYNKNTWDEDIEKIREITKRAASFEKEYGEEFDSAYTAKIEEMTKFRLIGITEKLGYVTLQFSKDMSADSTAKVKVTDLNSVSVVNDGDVALDKNDLSKLLIDLKNVPFDADACITIQSDISAADGSTLTGDKIFKINKRGFGDDFNSEASANNWQFRYNQYTADKTPLGGVLIDNQMILGGGDKIYNTDGIKFVYSTSGAVENYKDYAKYTDTENSSVEFDYKSMALNSKLAEGTTDYGSQYVYNYVPMRVMLRAGEFDWNKGNRAYDYECGVQSEQGAYILNITGDGAKIWLSKWDGSNLQIHKTSADKTLSRLTEDLISVDYKPTETVRYRITTQNITDGSVLINVNMAKYTSDGTLGEFKKVLTYTDTNTPILKGSTYFIFGETIGWANTYSAHYIDNYSFVTGCDIDEEYIIADNSQNTTSVKASISKKETQKNAAEVYLVAYDSANNEMTDIQKADISFENENAAKFNMSVKKNENSRVQLLMWNKDELTEWDNRRDLVNCENIQKGEFGVFNYETKAYYNADASNILINGICRLDDDNDSVKIKLVKQDGTIGHIAEFVPSTKNEYQYKFKFNESLAGCKLYVCENGKDTKEVPFESMKNAYGVKYTFNDTEGNLFDFTSGKTTMRVGYNVTNRLCDAFERDIYVSFYKADESLAGVESFKLGAGYFEGAKQGYADVAVPAESAYAKVMTWNSLGAMKPELESAKSSISSNENVRVVLMADSLAAYYSPETQASAKDNRITGFGNILADKFAAENVTFENLAVPGYRAYSYTNSQKTDNSSWTNIKSRLKPGDYLIVALCTNEVHASGYNGRFYMLDENGHRRWYKNNAYDEDTVVTATDESGEYFIDNGEKIYLSQLKSGYTDENGNYVSYVSRAIFELHSMIAKEAEELGVNVIFVSRPTTFNEGYPLTGKDDRNTAMEKVAKLYPNCTYIDVVEDTAKVIGAKTEAEKDEYYVLDHVHFTELGANLVADAIEKEIKASGDKFGTLFNK